jgi:glycosyltransferase involved in cell wall biosynthesis
VVEEKGVEEIVVAAASLREHFPGVSVVIGGTGQHLDKLRAFVQALDVAKIVHTPGWIDPSDVPSWLQAADVVVAPSKVREGQGLSIVEAMAIGKPVVATRSGGIVDTIEDGVTGLLVAPGDARALADAIRRLVENPRLAGTLGQRASEVARERFDRRRTARHFDSIYRSLLATRGRPADAVGSIQGGSVR